MPKIGFGTYKLLGETCTNAVRKALFWDYEHIDTAEIYANQKAIGEAIKELPREKIWITSKVWYDNLSYIGVKKACEESLKELNTNYLDLYLIHFPNKNIRMSETFNALNELKATGKIKNIGVSNFTISHLNQALGLGAKIYTNQVEFHPYCYQKELLDFCKEKNIILTAHTPLARGKVFKDQTLINIGMKYNKNPGQIALRWLLDKGIVVIPKSTKDNHIKDNRDLNFELSEEDTKIIDNLPQKRIVKPDFSEF